MLGEAQREAQHVFDVGGLEPGDILLSRIPMNLHDTSTWDSHLIQSLSRSRFSFAALHIGDGLFVEAVGSGVARLPLAGAGVLDARNICVLRLRKGYEWVGRRAAAAASRYLQRGFCRTGAPQTKCSAFHDVWRAAVAHSGLVANAYLDAEFALLEKTPSAIFPGDFAQATVLEDITERVLRRLNMAKRVAFLLDDESLFRRVQHWEVVTQLKTLCSYEVRRILDVQALKPSSMGELEGAIADNRWSALDEAVFRSLKWYRYADVYLLKQRQFFGEMAIPAGIARVLPAALSETQLASAAADAAANVQLLQAERAHWQQQLAYYQALQQRYRAKSFTYMIDLYSRQLAAGEQLLDVNSQINGLYQSEAKHRGLRLKIA